mmetsp:Transcript_25915/g.45723  ORF Transcript_25915/g.45723 Transcript_25915/m.45723 type:complete len:194 (-) Transcript_25915:122-703(-)
MVPLSQMQEMQRQMQQMQETIVMLQRQTTQTEVQMQAQLTAPPAAARPSKKEDTRPMTHEEKMALSQAISQLPNEKLSRVVEIIKERMPALQNEDDQEIEIDINALNAPTLRHLQRYVKSCTSRKRKSAPAQQPSPGLPDLDMDMDLGDLEADALGGADNKRSRIDSDALSLDLPLDEGLGSSDSEVEDSGEV